MTSYYCPICIPQTKLVNDGKGLKCPKCGSKFNKAGILIKPVKYEKLLAETRFIY